MAGLVSLLLGWVLAALVAGLTTSFALERFAKNLVSCRLTLFTFVLMLIKRDEAWGDAGRLEAVVKPDM